MTAPRDIPKNAELGQLEAFVLAARLHSFSRAANVIGVTQPSLSSRIIALESAVGERLFRRVGHGVQLTAAGALYLPFVTRALEALGSGRETLEASRNGTEGSLSIAVARSMSASTLPPLLAAFRDQSPAIDVTIKTGRSSDVLDLVLAREVQLGMGRALYHPDVVTQLLFDEQIVLVTHPDHPFTRSPVASIHDVAQEPLIVYDRGSTYFVLVEKVCRDAGIRLKIQMELDSVEATKRMVECGLGVSFLPASAIESELAQGSLVQVALEESYRIKLPTAVIHRASEAEGAIVASFLNMLAETYADSPPIGARNTSA